MKPGFAVCGLLSLLIIGGAAIVWLNASDDRPGRLKNGASSSECEHVPRDRSNAIADAQKDRENAALPQAPGEGFPHEGDSRTLPETKDTGNEQSPDAVPTKRGAPGWSRPEKPEGPIEFPPVILRASIDRPLPTEQEFEQYQSLPIGAASYAPDRKEPNSASIMLDISVRDLESGEPTKSGIIEVWADNSDAVWRVRTSNRSNRTSIDFPFDRSKRYIARAVCGSRVGCTVLSAKEGGSLIGGGFAPTISGTVKFGGHCTILVWSADSPRGRQVRASDGHGRPFAGADLWWYSCWMGTSDKDGIISPPMWGEFLNEPNSEPHKTLPWRFNARFAVHAPGCVPIFITREEIAQADQPPIDVCLRARELAVTVFDGVGLEFHLGHGAHLDALTELKSTPVVTDAKSLKVALQVSSIYLRNLPTAVGQPAQSTWPEDYGYWYCKQWIYDARAGRWDVVLPYAGKFALMVGYQDQTQAVSIYLYIDASDPGNVTGRVIAAPQR